MRRLFLIVLLGLPGLAFAQQYDRDADLIETCLAEEAHRVPEPCRGLILSGCTGDRITCLKREALAWDAVLGRNWTFRCSICAGGFSVAPRMRLRAARERLDCPDGEEGDLVCLIDETARQATHLFLRNRRGEDAQ